MNRNKWENYHLISDKREERWKEWNMITTEMLCKRDICAVCIC